MCTKLMMCAAPGAASTSLRLFQLVQISSSPGESKFEVGTFALDSCGSRLALISHLDRENDQEQGSSEHEQLEQPSKSGLWIWDSCSLESGCHHVPFPSPRSCGLEQQGWHCLCFSPEGDFLLLVSKTGDLLVIPTNLFLSKSSKKGNFESKYTNKKKSEDRKMFL